MGGGKKKVHQQFNVTPSSVLPSTISVIDVPATSPHVLEELPMGNLAEHLEGIPGFVADGSVDGSSPAMDPTEDVLDAADSIPSAATHASPEAGDGAVGVAGGEATNPENADSQDANMDPTPVLLDKKFEWDAPEQPIIPIPEPGEITTGDGLGTHLLIGGADYYDSTVSVTNYDGPQGMQQVMSAVVTPETEYKILEALSAAAPMIPKEITETMTDRLPIDKSEGLFNDLETAAKSVNHHIPLKDGLPSHTLARIEKLEQRFADLKKEYPEGSQERAMVDHYEANLKPLQDVRDDFDAAATNSSLVPFVTKYEGSYETTRTIMVPKEGAGPLPTTVEPVSVLNVELHGNGQSRTDGKFSNIGEGYQYRITLSDGYEAIYRPHNAVGPSQPAPSAAMRGQLDIIAPPGTDNPAQTVSQLVRMNLVSTPLTKAEAEYSYLQSNIYAQKLGGKPQVKDALAASEALIQAAEGDILSRRAHQAAGMTSTQLKTWAQEIRLEAEHRSLGPRVATLRDATAKAVGLPNGEALLHHQHYSPVPNVGRTGVTWNRFSHSAEDIDAYYKNAKRTLIHHSNAHGLLAMIKSGAFASQVKRRRMGVSKAVGMSEGMDVNTGGARTVFLRSWNASGVKSNMIIWENPGTLLQRTDWYAYNADKYGKPGSESVRDPLKVAAHVSNANELMFHDGIDLFGPQGPSQIRISDKAVRKQAIDYVKGTGVKAVRGIPVEQWISD